MLHEESKKWLKELGYIPFGEEIDHQEDAAEVSFNDQELEGGFYEVEEVLGRWLCKNMTYEFQVRFKRVTDRKTICGCPRRRSTERYPFRRHHVSAERDKTSKTSSAHTFEPPAKMSKSPWEKKHN